MICAGTVFAQGDARRRIPATIWVSPASAAARVIARQPSFWDKPEASPSRQALRCIGVGAGAMVAVFIALEALLRPFA
ncbi:MAG: hypothetical protein BGP06_05700 [Rhizobiales bacterium 65-9]|nr:hypothetical protein [Hyphomicrobiales bacterium]OJY35364.1 MAG: hypothetical protein BGP06_05700 [Rhizobiales bacterium 65-9]